MMFLLLLLLLCLQFVSGYSVVKLFRLDLSGSQKLSLSFLIGLALCSFSVFILELSFIPINLISILLIFILISIALFKLSGAKLIDLKIEFKFSMPSLALYEYLFLAVLAILYLISFWRCFYLPPFARDVLVGAELLAEYAVKEGTLVSSVFTDGIRISTNNLFKPPFILNLQIVYKAIGFSFGKVWMIQIVLCFIVYLYSVLRDKQHPIVTGLLLILFTAIPDLYAYSFILLYDYSNAVYFTLAIYFLHSYKNSRQANYLYISSLLFAIATHIRSETLFFAAIAGVFLFVVNWSSIKDAVKSCAIMILPSLGLYVLWHLIFVKIYLPVDYVVSEQLNSGLLDLSALLNIFNEINSELVFGHSAHQHFAYFIEIFLVFVLVDLVFFRKNFSVFYLLWVCVLYFGFVLLVHMFPLIEIENTVKRGFFKIFGICILYLSSSPVLQTLSRKIHKWEDR